jgi:hypothetical protein
MGFYWPEARFAAWYYKTHIRTPPSEFTEAEAFWLLKGYNEYYATSNW